MGRLAESIEIANPQHPKVAAVVLIDTSASMGDQAKLSKVSQGLGRLVEELRADALCRKRVELSLVTFGTDVEMVHPFASPGEFTPPAMIAAGTTPMAEAIRTAAKLIDQRKQEYKVQGVDYYRPWIFMLTDGEPTDMQQGDGTWTQVRTLLHEAEENRRFLFMPVVAQPGNVQLLAQLAHPSRPPVQLEGLRFVELFQWLSRSLARLSLSRPGDRVPLDPIAAWATV